MSKQHRDNHNDNKDYIHDLDSYEVGMHNCLSIPFDKLLKDGFDTRQTDVRGAGAVYTASQLVAVIFQVQSLQQFGGVSSTHIDWTMVPYVRKSFYKHYIDGLKYIKGIEGEEIDMINIPIEELSIEHGWYKADEEVYRYAMDMTERECHQAVEGLFHNLNTLQSRSGNQLPFTSLNYGTCTLAEGRMYTKAILRVSIEGLGKFGRTAIFPCQIFQIRRGVNDKPGTPNYDLKQLALESTSKRLYPNYCLTNWSNHEKWVDLDRKNKLDYVNSLNKDDYDTLVEQIKKHPELKELLDLDVIEVEEND
jgi:ribonucleoside-triphosphate reductase